MHYKVASTIVIYIFLCGVYTYGKYDPVIFLHHKEIVLNDEEKALMEKVKKELTAFGFQAVQQCVLSPENCNSSILLTILEENSWQEAKLYAFLHTYLLYLYDDTAQKLFAYQTLSPWVPDDFIEDVFEKHSSSKERADGLLKELLPLVRKLKKFFLAHKI